MRWALRRQSPNGKEGGFGMGKNPGKAEWRGPASSMEIGVEGEVYALSLWWEIPPALRKKQGDGRDGFGRQRGEVRGGGDSRGGWRVGEKSGTGPKEQRRSEDVTGEQVGGEGRGEFENWAHLGRVTGRVLASRAMGRVRLDRVLAPWA
ncbi:hypothetical protein CK203_112194 [Vitis vinifera]|uniref:DUF4283 domain-containing protein n=1 Tax=Vitis vinifera TaxID=29760 RepID=A0A438CSE5_VITVI|nr:hypothetical protein CK203_112194 [Vitis vinifera]